MPIPQNHFAQDRSATRPAEAPDWQAAVSLLVKSLKFGAVQIIIHDGRIIQFDVIEKIRTNQLASRSTPINSSHHAYLESQSISEV
jgi:hypothetical protein